MKEEVAKDVAALNRLFVGRVVALEVRIVGCNPFGRVVVCPEAVILAFLSLVQCCATVACCFISLDVLATVLIEPDLVHDPRN
jgi:hypothetical protein